MALSATFFVVAVAVIAIWVVIEVKRLKHKLLAIFLIGLIIFTYVSFSVSLRGKDVNLKSVDGVITAGKLYFAWLGSLFHNVKSVTAFATKQNWTEYNDTIPKTNNDSIWNKL
jgi:glucan phosphoethanolaminetransferase (alkaline phosphatase superfamily)